VWGTIYHISLSNYLSERRVKYFFVKGLKLSPSLLSSTELSLLKEESFQPIHFQKLLHFYHYFLQSPTSQKGPHSLDLDESNSQKKVDFEWEECLKPKREQSW
jgi:hypothetical protein